MNTRINDMRKHIDGLNDAGVRKTYFYSLAYESLKETKGNPIEIRRSKAQAHILDNAPLAVHPFELIAGSMSDFCPVFEEKKPYNKQRQEAIRILEEYINNTNISKHVSNVNKSKIKTFEQEFTSKKSRWALMSRVYHDASITYKDLQCLKKEMEDRFSEKLEKYEIGRELERGFKIDYGNNVKQEIDSLPWFAANHLNLNYAAIMNQGFESVLADINLNLKTVQNEEQAQYYTAAKDVTIAASRFVLRYSQKLRECSTAEESIRKAELIEMADICENISQNKAETFREGIQFVWLLHIMASFLWGSALSFGRFDQYMLTLYENDIKTGAMTKSGAKELLCCMWLKINEPCMRTVQSITIGGVTPEGDDAANPLTALCLEIEKEMKLPYPNMGLRISCKSPRWLYDMAIDSIKEGAGQPMVLTDALWIPNLIKLGYDERTANDYYNMGCVEIMIPGKQPNWGVTEPIAFPMLYENIFEKYRAGNIVIDSFESFKQAYLNELKKAVAANKLEADSKATDMAGKCYDPFASLMTDGCIKQGKDIFQGGSEFGIHWSFYAYGLGTAADAMTAIKKYVYDEKVVTIAEMADALRENFKNNELLRLMLNNKTPCYGNDYDEVDAVADFILSGFNSMVFELNSPDNRDKYVSTLFGYFFHIYHGEITGATANGRKKGEPFSDSMGPSQGKDENGPTKMLNSVLSLDHSMVTGGYALNLKINPDLVRDKAGSSILKALIKTYIDSSGPQIQINFVDAESLIKAQKEPDRYRNLIVRIGGYCEYFVNLDSALQEEIITRTVHGL